MNKPENLTDDISIATAKRGNNRDSLLVKATLRFPSSGDEGEVRVRNISSGGLMAEAPLRVPRGDVVEVKLRNIGWVTGKVAWVAETRFGISFDYPIDPKATHQSIGSNATSPEVPHYLAKLNRSEAPKKLRPL
jgi:PilZ domain